MTITEVALRGVLATALAVSPSEIGDDASMETIEVWDSLKQLQIVLALESAFDVSFGEEEAMEITSVGSIREALEKRGFSVIRG
jgi:acyl carrier protein